MKKSGYTGKAYVVEKTGHCLALAFEITLVDGIVIKKEAMGKQAPDRPVVAIDLVTKAVWKQYQGDTND